MWYYHRSLQTVFKMLNSKSSSVCELALLANTYSQEFWQKTILFKTLEDLTGLLWVLAKCYSVQVIVHVELLFEHYIQKVAQN